MSETKKTVIDSLVRAVRLVGRMNKNRADAAPSEQLYYSMLDKYFSNVLNAKQQNGFVAAHTVFFPVEILYAMGITPLHNEVTTWTTAMLLGNQMDFITAGAEAGLAPEICSPHRGLAGGYFKKMLPIPDAIVWTNLICDNTAKSGEYIAELTGAPSFFLDHRDKSLRFDHLADHRTGTGRGPIRAPVPLLWSTIGITLVPLFVPVSPVATHGRVSLR